jgi:ATP-dependent Lhr-like helicase
LRDALGVPLPIGVPTAFLDPVDDPVGDLVSRYVRTHGPFTAQDAADRLGLGVAVVTDVLRRFASDRRVMEGEFRPGATGTEWVDAEILRRLRRRSLAALRSEVEPVPQRALGRFLPSWHRFGDLRGIDGLVTAIDQLAGVALPASTWESMVLPSRVRDYQPSMLDELTVSGEVLWSGRGELSGGDGWVSLHLADAAPLTLAEPNLTDQGELHGRIIDALAGGGAFFFRQLSTAVGLNDPVDDKDLAAALWDLVWAGLVGNDTLAPLRARLGATTTRARATPRSRTHRARARVASTLAQSAPPTVAGRWSLLPAPEPIPTIRSAALAETLLERHGVVTRGAVVSEGIVGGFALAYKILSSLEETGRTRRGYFVEGLGAAQFATPATVDRLRTFAADPEEGIPRLAVTMGATDPANPYGAALGWPEAEGHRPGRKAGALVVLVDGALEVYVERGGKTVLTFTADEERLRVAAESLAQAVRRSGGRLRVEKIDGAFSIGTPFGHALGAAGFAPTPQGMRLRA